MLKDVQTGASSIKDMMERSSLERKRLDIQRCFVKLTNVSSWSEAEEKFPNATESQNIDRFMHMEFKKEIPQVTVQFIIISTYVQQACTGFRNGCNYV